MGEDRSCWMCDCTKLSAPDLAVNFLRENLAKVDKKEAKVYPGLGKVREQVWW